MNQDDFIKDLYQFAGKETSGPSFPVSDDPQNSSKEPPPVSSEKSRNSESDSSGSGQNDNKKKQPHPKRSLIPLVLLLLLTASAIALYLYKSGTFESETSSVESQLQTPPSVIIDGRKASSGDNPKQSGTPDAKQQDTETVQNNQNSQPAVEPGTVSEDISGNGTANPDNGNSTVITGIVIDLQNPSLPDIAISANNTMIYADNAPLYNGSLSLVRNLNRLSDKTKTLLGNQYKVIPASGITQDVVGYKIHISSSDKKYFSAEIRQNQAIVILLK